MKTEKINHFEEKIFGNELVFDTSEELFSPYHLDSGSKFLLETIEIPDSGNFVDLGCGYGAMGVSIAKAKPNCHVYLVDDNSAATKIAQQNVKTNEVKNAATLKSNGLYLVQKTKKISLIFTNPPWHNMEETERFIDQAFEVLEDNGTFWMVIRQEFPIQDEIGETFGNCTEVKRQSPYKILKAVKDPNYVSLKKELISLLVKNNIALDPALDQHMLIDNKTLNLMAATIDPKPSDEILEIGCGDGFLTKRLASKAKKVIGIELDKKFRPILDSLPRNVEMHYGKAWDILHDDSLKLKYNKVIANLPYSLSEPIMHRYTHLPIDMLVFLLPEKFVEKLNNHHIFAAYYKLEAIGSVPRAAFFPRPKTNSSLIKFTQLPKKLTSDNVGLWIRRFLYEHEEAKVKNTLRLAVEKIFAQLKNKKLTKNEARKIVADFSIPENLSEGSANNSEIYFIAQEKVENTINK